MTRASRPGARKVQGLTLDGLMCQVSRDELLLLRELPNKSPGQVIGADVRVAKQLEARGLFERDPTSSGNGTWRSTERGDAAAAKLTLNSARKIRAKIVQQMNGDYFGIANSILKVFIERVLVELAAADSETSVVELRPVMLQALATSEEYRQRVRAIQTSWSEHRDEVLKAVREELVSQVDPLGEFFASRTKTK